MATKEVCSAGGPIHYAVFFCTDEGFGIEMVQALDEAHAVDIVQALQPGAVARAVPAASLEGKNKQPGNSCCCHWGQAPGACPWA
jgi:hypothetical protein